MTSAEDARTTGPPTDTHAIARRRRDHILRHHVNLTQPQALERMLHEDLTAATLWQSAEQLDAVYDLACARHTERLDVWVGLPPAQRAEQYTLHVTLDDEDARQIGHPTRFFGFVRKDSAIVAASTRSAVLLLRATDDGWLLYNAYPDVTSDDTVVLPVPTTEYLMATGLWAAADPLRKAFLESNCDGFVKSRIQFDDPGHAIRCPISEDDDATGEIRLTRSITEVRLDGDPVLRIRHEQANTLMALALPATMSDIRAIRTHISYQYHYAEIDRESREPMGAAPLISFSVPVGTKVAETPERRADDSGEDAPDMDAAKRRARERARRRSRQASKAQRSKRAKGRAARKGRRQAKPQAAPVAHSSATTFKSPTHEMFWDLLANHGLMFYNPKTLVVTCASKANVPFGRTVWYSLMPHETARKCLDAMRESWDGDVERPVFMPDEVSALIDAVGHNVIGWRSLRRYVNQMAETPECQLLAPDDMLEKIYERYGVKNGHVSIEACVKIHEDGDEG